jgi:hypothetical protein
MESTSSIEQGAFVEREHAVLLPDGRRYRVCGMGRKRIRGQVSDFYLDVLESSDGGSTWQPVPLRASPLNAVRASASDWPPEQAIAASVSDDGRLQIEYENRYDPWARAKPSTLTAHARWLARYDTRWKWWHLKQLRLMSEDEPAGR